MACEGAKRLGPAITCHTTAYESLVIAGDAPERPRLLRDFKPDAQLDIKVFAVVNAPCKVKPSRRIYMYSTQREFLPGGTHNLPRRPDFKTECLLQLEAPVESLPPRSNARYSAWPGAKGTFKAYAHRVNSLHPSIVQSDKPCVIVISVPVSYPLTRAHARRASCPSDAEGASASSCAASSLRRRRLQPPSQSLSRNLRPRPSRRERRWGGQVAERDPVNPSSEAQVARSRTQHRSRLDGNAAHPTAAARPSPAPRRPGARCSPAVRTGRRWGSHAWVDRRGPRDSGGVEGRRRRTRHRGGVLGGGWGGHRAGDALDKLGLGGAGTWSGSVCARGRRRTGQREDWEDGRGRESGAGAIGASSNTAGDVTAGGGTPYSKLGSASAGESGGTAVLRWLESASEVECVATESARGGSSEAACASQCPHSG
ncbi:hypothetical protein FB451DRAFT_1454181 [Mycena latifolia]|nr:hypothetical protein FB451DRAFT_1454181 [Mycena latifolia]